MFHLYGQVAIIQIASDKKAFIFDLIKLYEDDPKALDCCFRRIMCSSNILKLGTMLIWSITAVYHMPVFLIRTFPCCAWKELTFFPLQTIGYNLQCDLHQLSQSYGELLCFQSYEMLLDIQKLFKETTGGLSGLSKVFYDLKNLQHSAGIQLICSSFYVETMTSYVPLYVWKYYQKILGAGLNKTRRNSDWEQRPLSQNQVFYSPTVFFCSCFFKAVM